MHDLRQILIPVLQPGVRPAGATGPWQPPSNSDTQTTTYNIWKPHTDAMETI